MLPQLRFSDRAAAGKALLNQIVGLTRPPTVVLGIPRGGISIAAPIAQTLGAPLAAVWVRKLISPSEPEVTIGAVDLDGDVTLSVETMRAEGLTDERLAEIAYHTHKCLLTDWERTPGLEAAALLPGTTAIIVDDALVTGMTLRAAMRWARKQFVRATILAVPVVDSRIWHKVAADADTAITLEERDGVVARSEVYEQFGRVPPDRIAALLEKAAQRISRA